MKQRSRYIIKPGPWLARIQRSTGVIRDWVERIGRLMAEARDKHSLVLVLQLPYIKAVLRLSALTLSPDLPCGVQALVIDDCLFAVFRRGCRTIALKREWLPT